MAAGPRATRAIRRSWPVVALLLVTVVAPLPVAAAALVPPPVAPVHTAPAPSLPQAASADWDQYQGSAAHDGASPNAGPAKAHEVWAAAGGSGQLGLSASGTTLVVNSMGNRTVREYNLATGKSTGGFGYNSEIENLPTSSTSVYYIEYNSWCCYGSDSLLIDGKYSGAAQWNYGLPSSPQANWLMSEANSLLFVAASGSPTLLAFSASSGTSSWSTTLPSGISTIPTVGGSLVLVGYTTRPNVTALNYYSGAVQWNFTTDSPVGSPAIAALGSRYYFGTEAGTVYAISNTGKQLWAFHDGGTPIVTTPAVKGPLTFVTAGSTLYALDTKNGKLNWSVQMPGILQASPVVSSKGVVYVGSSVGALAAFAPNGTRLWHTNVGGPIGDGMLLGKKTLVVATTDGWMYEFGTTAGNVTGPTLASADWGQYQGGPAHSGASGGSGPTSPTLLWSSTGLGGTSGITSVGNTLVVSNQSNDTVDYLNLSNGHYLSKTAATLESLNAVQSTDGYEVNFVWYYSWCCYGAASEVTGTEYDARLSTVPGGLWNSGLGTHSGWLLASNGNLLLVGLQGSNLLYGLDPGTGRILWSASLPGALSTIPTFGDGQIVVGYSNTTDVSALSLAGQLLWNFSAAAPVGSESIAYADGTYYFGTNAGTVYAVTSSGTQLWSYAARGGPSIPTTPAVGGGSVYFGTSNGDLYDLGAANGSKLWSTHLGGSVDASPVLASNGLYVGDSNGYVYAVGPANGTVLWKYSVGVPIADGLVLGADLLLVQDTSGDLYAL